MARRPWRLLSADDSQVTLAIREPMEVRSLLGRIGLSRPWASRVLQGGRLGREGVTLSATDQLDAGDVVTMALEVAEPDWPDVPPATILMEDAILLAAEKPRGLIVHGDGTGAETLTDRVQAHLAREGRIRCAQAIQRLDRDTTGVVLFSLAPEFQGVLDGQLAQGRVTKGYLAVVRGRAPWERHDISQPIGRDRHAAGRMHVGSGRPAMTHLEVRGRTVRDGKDLTLLSVAIDTGRRHQIRAHLAWAGLPVLGDTLYGSDPWEPGLMLHCLEEGLDHPLTGGRLRVCSPVPERFVALFPELAAEEGR